MSGKKISDLPLYPSTESDYGKKPVWVVLEKQEKSSFEEGIRSVREGTEGLVQSFQQQKQHACQYYQSTKSSFDSQLNTLSHEYHLFPKLAFISLSGLSGLLIGFRRSTFRKIVYSTVLGGSAAALCYPKEARDYSGQVYNVAAQNAYALYRQYVWPEEGKAKGGKKESAAPVVNEQQTGNAKDKVVKLDTEAIRSAKTTKEIKGDKGQSSDVDKDMYTTRK